MPENTQPYVYKITWRGRVLGEECLNTFFYAGPDIAASLPGLAVAQEATVYGVLFNQLSNQYILDSIDIEGVKGDTAFGNATIGVPGNITGDCLPPFASWDFTLLRGGVGERNGYKRFGGVPETMQVNGVATSAAVTLSNLSAVGLFADITDSGHTYEPVIERTQIHHVAQHPPKYFDISNVLYSRIGSQNSRKFGHGR